ncbi:glutamate racemase [Breznakia blatticola]|uniref:Glutamate racemase n=1 Tax=Breznakia blatticola TaxID=1754012 RepID=A0A4R7ZRN6_9FIRM|nr:glutamate racemase [Breznakia blatticola]TDW20633.1 glutamate racemase [Breznakia blatticola]
MNNNPIGVFDSGLGGISVLNTCLTILPNEHYIYYGDSLHAPYGTKPKEDVLARCIEICDYFIQKNAKAIVVACNTATSVAITELRKRYSIPIIGMEPALKVAAHNKENKNIIVMATPLTLKEKKFASLMANYANNSTILKMPCPEFVEIVEHGMQDVQSRVNKQIDVYKDLIQDRQIDSIVLGCTHFLFVKQEIENYFNHNVQMIDGNEGTARQLKHLLEIDGNLGNHKQKVEIFNSDESKLPLSYQLVDA